MKLNKIIIFTLGVFFFCLVAFTLIEIFVVSKARANPACTVSDDLEITGQFGMSGNRMRFKGVDGANYSWISRTSDDSKLLIGWDANGNTNIGCITVYGGCLDVLGQNKKCSPKAGDCFCSSGQNQAWVQCPTGLNVVGGGCSSDSNTESTSHNFPSGVNRWGCDWVGGVGFEKATAICCRITMEVDP